MKIYTEQPELPPATGNKTFDDLIQKYLEVNMELFRHKLMWQLRSLESTLEQYDGHIIIKKDGELEFNGYPDDVLASIRELL